MSTSPPRRKLLQASLSAPLVLTVGKAAGATARTTFSACLSNNENKAPPPSAVTNPDEALRVSRDVFEIYRPQGAKGVPAKLEGRYIVGWDEETLFRIDETGFSRRLTPTAGLNARAPDLVLRPQGKVEVLAYLDDQGNVVGIAPEPNGGIWAMKSCYASMMGQAREPKKPWWG